MRKVFIFFIILFFPSFIFGIDGTTLQTSFFSPNTGKEIPFTIYLPPKYNDETNSYPIIFHLHGIGGTHNGNQIALVPESFEKAMNKGLIEKAIIVFPDGFKDAFWSDSKNSDKPAEFNLINELIPYIKKNYNVKENCISIQGFSMGGFGASKIFSKYPDLFKVLISYDGAFLNVDGMIKYHNALWLEIFGGDSIYFKENSPWEFFKTNSDALRNKPIRILKGSLGYNNAFNTHLFNLYYNHDYVETGCEHALKCLLDAEGERSWFVISQAFANCSETSIVENKEYDNIFPNPAGEFIQFNLNEINPSEAANIQIYNSLGECVMLVEQISLSVQSIQNVQKLQYSFCQTGTSDLLRIDISHLPAGVYFVRVGDNTKMFLKM